MVTTENSTKRLLPSICHVDIISSQQSLRSQRQVGQFDERNRFTVLTSLHSAYVVFFQGSGKGLAAYFFVI